MIDALLLKHFVVPKELTLPGWCPEEERPATDPPSLGPVYQPEMSKSRESAGFIAMDCLLQEEEPTSSRLLEEISCKLRSVAQSAQKYPPSMRYIILATITLATLIVGATLSWLIGRKQRSDSRTATVPKCGSIPEWCPSQEDV